MAGHPSSHRARYKRIAAIALIMACILSVCTAVIYMTLIGSWTATGVFAIAAVGFYAGAQELQAPES